MDSPETYMELALALAREAAADGEVPVGCVIADADGTVIGRGRNRREKSRSALAHAEIEAIEEACRAKGDWRLDRCSLYVTLEPCPMCAGAILNARIGRLYYGRKDPSAGSCGSILNLFMENYGHEPEITGGVLREECVIIMDGFFGTLRKGKKEEGKKQAGKG